MAILPSTRWQPYGGDVQFELTGIQSPLSDVAVYFAWSDRSGAAVGGCVQSTRVRLLPALDGDDSQTYRYAARVPYLDKSWVSGSDHWTTASTVPLVDLYVAGVSTGDKAPIGFVANVGISTPWLAFGGAILSGALVWAVLACWASARKIPGGPFLGIISTPNGVASLSQFQILIWTFVIGIGVVYVMMLSGNLIDIPTSTLGLLGITGFALVGSKLATNADGSPQTVNAPGAVTGLTVLGTPTANTIVLSWTAPAGTPQPFSYTVQMQAVGGGVWTSVAHDIAGPPFAVTGLDQNTSYQFQVFATNAGGAGPAAVPVVAQTTAVAANAVPAPAQVTGVKAVPAKDGTVALSWSNQTPGPDSYVVQYRRAGTLPWATYNTNTSSPVVMAGLDPGTTYEFHVFVITGGTNGTPSALATATTATRQPRWSDLVMSGSSYAAEVDLARLQMLVFTTITAVFTAITLINTGVIPDLPVGELALVGISNGVYLASKVSS